MTTVEASDSTTAKYTVRSGIQHSSDASALIQSGAEPTDTFQIVIDNIQKEGKICETVYKYVQVCYLLPTDYKLIF